MESEIYDVGVAGVELPPATITGQPQLPPLNMMLNNPGVFTDVESFVFEDSGLGPGMNDVEMDTPTTGFPPTMMSDNLLSPTNQTFEWSLEGGDPMSAAVFDSLAQGASGVPLPYQPTASTHMPTTMQQQAAATSAPMTSMPMTSMPMTSMPMTSMPMTSMPMTSMGMSEVAMMPPTSQGLDQSMYPPTSNGMQAIYADTVSAASGGGFSDSSQGMMSESSGAGGIALRNEILKFLRARGRECKLTVMTCKYAQKSYGTERRYFTPPPLLCFGGQWNMDACKIDAGFDLNCESGGSEQLGPDGRVLFRKIHLTTASNKFCSVHFKLVGDVAGSLRNIGVFQSKDIKIVPKPKKKQSAKDVESCVTSGSKIALFNRIRSQTTTTAYMTVENDVFCTSSTTWDDIVILGLGQSQQSICYGQHVVLASATTQQKLQFELVIRKVEMPRQKDELAIVVKDSNDPVSQLHKVAFEIVGGNSYLGVRDDGQLGPLPPNSVGATEDRIGDKAAWTVVSTDRIEYKFSELNSRLSSYNAITPFPVVQALKMQSATMLELHGSSFNESLQVWFGGVPVQTHFVCGEVMWCIPPSAQELQKALDIASPNGVRLEVPILLLRSDGVLYVTDHNYIFDSLPVTQYDYSQFQPFDMTQAF